MQVKASILFNLPGGNWIFRGRKPLDEGPKRMIAIDALACVRSVFKSGENSLIYKTSPYINQNIILELLEFRSNL
jgi:hypothetical protein